MNNRKKLVVWQFAVGAFLAAATVYVSDRWILESIWVPSGSMEPTILRGERLLVAKWPDWSFVSAKINRFEVVVIDSRVLGHRIIKRVIGLPGECVELQDGYRVSIDGKSLDLKSIEAADIFEETQNFEHAAAPSHLILRFHEPNLSFDTVYGKPPGYCLGTNEYYALGDHRWRSADSRTFGAVTRKEIDGRALVVWLSVNHKTGQLRWNRIGQGID
jgi:signal peptidase I